MMSNKLTKEDLEKHMIGDGLVLTCSDNSYTREYVKQQGKSTILITRNMFNNYREVQHGGCWNMMMDWREAANDAYLAPPAYWTIINNYSQLAEHFGDFASQPSDDYDESEEEYKSEEERENSK